MWYSNEQNKLTNQMEREAWIHGTDWPVPKGRVCEYWRQKVKGLAKGHICTPYEHG